MTKITLSTTAARALKRKSYVRVKTAFLTTAGPAKGTIWFGGNRETQIVSDVTRLRRRTIVRYVSGDYDFLDEFLDFVSTGKYILVGAESDFNPSVMPKLL